MAGKLQNFYTLTKHLNKDYHNPNYKRHMMQLPFRLLICGGSGAGKTNTLMNLIKRMSGTFNTIVICCKSKEEPLYQYLEEKAGDSVQFYEGINNIPSVDQFADCGQTLVVFDDLVLDKNQGPIEQFFIRGRKVGDGISCAYLSQSYFKTPKTIRLQCNYMMLKKLSSTRDLNMILNDFALGVDKKALGKLYKAATADMLSFLMIDVNNEDMKFRKGFVDVLSWGE